MMKKIALLSSVLILAACGNDTRSQMKDAINNASAFNQVCIPYQLNIDQLVSGTSPFDGTFGNSEVRILKRNSNGKRTNEQAEKQMDMLVKAGLYQSEKEEKIGEGKQQQRIAVYKITDKATSHIRHTPRGALLCVGTQQVDKINFYTEPTASRGLTVSQVSYDAKVVPEKWAKSLLKESSEHQYLLENYTTKTTTLVKTDDGWRDVRELHDIMK